MLLCVADISEADAQLLFVLQSPFDPPTALHAKLERQKVQSDPSGCVGKDGGLLAAQRGQGTPSPWYTGAPQDTQCCCSLAQPPVDR